MKPEQDPTEDIYKLLNEAGLDTGNFLDSKKGMSRIVSEVRTSLTQKLKSYIVRRDHEMYNAGHAAAKPRKIKVKDD